MADVINEDELFTLHIIPPEALYFFLRNKYPILGIWKIKQILLHAPAIRVPISVLKRYFQSQTTILDDDTIHHIETDDIPAAIEKFFFHLREASDYSDERLETLRTQIFELHKINRWLP